MNKQDLIRKVAVDSEITQRQAGIVLDNTFSLIMDALAEGDKVQILGFGTFEARQRAARSGRNPSTGETMEIPATTVPVFKPGREFKEAVN